MHKAKLSFGVVLLSLVVISDMSQITNETIVAW